MAIAQQQTKPFRIGDWVVFPFGANDAFAQVTELRGPIGVRGRRLYRITIPGEDSEEDSFELSEEDIEPAPPPDKQAVIDYLAGGGLLAILRAHLGSPHERPRAWITYDSSGRLTHTFDESPGILGGAPVPYFALHEEQIFAGKKDQVARYLETFGLSPKEAEQVIDAIGTAP